jgi:hypothetical protein
MFFNPLCFQDVIGKLATLLKKKNAIETELAGTTPNDPISWPIRT